MKKAIVFVVVLPICALGWFCFAQEAKPLSPCSQSKQSDAFCGQRARSLFELASQENPRLRWDSCLAMKASSRAKRMVAQHYFDHEDPKTGKNPVWKTVSQCVPARRKGSKVPAGENLTKGVDSPANIHKALMKSPSHRKNILNRRFNHAGVGCYDSICVELFAGY